MELRRESVSLIRLFLLGREVPSMLDSRENAAERILGLLNIGTVSPYQRRHVLGRRGRFVYFHPLGLILCLFDFVENREDGCSDEEGVSNLSKKKLVV